MAAAGTGNRAYYIKIEKHTQEAEVTRSGLFFLSPYLEPVFKTQNAPEPADFLLCYVNSPWNTYSIPAANFLA